MTSRLLILLLLAPGCAGSSSEGASRGVGEESSVPFVKIATASEHVFGDEVELSATLEDEHGSDPYSAGDMPETLADIQAFYASVAG